MLAPGWTWASCRAAEHRGQRDRAAPRRSGAAGGLLGWNTSGRSWIRSDTGALEHWTLSPAIEGLLGRATPLAGDGPHEWEGLPGRMLWG
jgi:hypothetical protein